MNLNKKVLAGILIILVLIVLMALLWKGQKVIIKTDKAEYDNASVMRVKIKNYSLDNICFSSCYPYYLEWKTGPLASIEWSAYPYESCSDRDLAEKCLGPLRTKSFEIDLPRVKQGVHRISVPVCQNQGLGSEFKETGRFYSNEFEIK